jgi:hypothetical protein
MARINNFLREQRALTVDSFPSQVDRAVDSSPHRRALGFQVLEAAVPTKKIKRKARPDDFALLLADDAEKNFDKMIPLTKERVERARALLEGVELD